MDNNIPLAGCFMLATVALVWVSRASLRAPGSHGFYRFFAWEAIVALFCLNGRVWFVSPRSPRQMVSWLLLTGSLVLIILAVGQLRRHGRADGRRQDASLLGIEKTTTLVTGGVYGLIRHPMYSSLLLLAWGICCKQPGWAAVALALAASGCLWLTARAEEQENLRYFGGPYRAYMRRTRRFLPYLF